MALGAIPMKHAAFSLRYNILAAIRGEVERFIPMISPPQLMRARMIMLAWRDSPQNEFTKKR